MAGGGAWVRRPRLGGGKNGREDVADDAEAGGCRPGEGSGLLEWTLGALRRRSGGGGS